MLINSYKGLIPACLKTESVTSPLSYVSFCLNLIFSVRKNMELERNNSSLAISKRNPCFFFNSRHFNIQLLTCHLILICAQKNMPVEIFAPYTFGNICRICWNAALAGFNTLTYCLTTPSLM